MGQHRPEPTQGNGWNGITELGDIQLQKRSDGVLPPLVTDDIGLGQQRIGESAQIPWELMIGELKRGIHQQLVVCKGAKFNQIDSPGQGFRIVADQICEDQRFFQIKIRGGFNFQYNMARLSGFPELAWSEESSDRVRIKRMPQFSFKSSFNISLKIVIHSFKVKR